MKKLILFFVMHFTSIALAGSVIGKWKSIDDETGKPKSIIEITQDGDYFKGRIVELINPEEENPICKKCQNDKKDQPIKGMEIIWGFKEKKSGEEWGDGKILDPQNGKIYSCRMRLKDDGKKLEVRGYIGISLLGRSQMWLREE